MKYLLVLIVAAQALGARTSDRAVLTCDFRPVESSHTGTYALGNLQFTIDLKKKDVPVKCLSDECVVKGEETSIQLISILGQGDRAAFSDNTKADFPRMIFYGSTGEDAEFMVVTNYDKHAILTLMVDSNIDQSTKPVMCTVQLR